MFSPSGCGNTLKGAPWITEPYGALRKRWLPKTEEDHVLVLVDAGWSFHGLSRAFQDLIFYPFLRFFPSISDSIRDHDHLTFDLFYMLSYLCRMLGTTWSAQTHAVFWMSNNERHHLGMRWVNHGTYVDAWCWCCWYCCLTREIIYH